MPPEVVPPPWRLRGRGYVFAYSFPEAFVQAQELPSGLRGALRRADVEPLFVIQRKTRNQSDFALYRVSAELCR